VPVGRVVSAPACRARQTAELAFGRIDSVSLGLAHTPVSNAANAAAFKKALQDTLTTVSVDPGKNAVITAHGNTLENHPDLFVEGSHLFGGQPIGETGFYVIKRESDGKLRIVQKFATVAELASNGIDLQVK
jgi:hypothetical protein